MALIFCHDCRDVSNTLLAQRSEVAHGRQEFMTGGLVLMLQKADRILKFMPII
jgi:hypothetical protein